MNNTNTVKIGLIGSGGRLRGVVKKLIAAGNGKIEVRAVYDPNPTAIKTTQELFGKEVEVCSSEEELLSHPGISWVFVGSINSLHKRHILGALKAGKNVFAEKPLATTIQDCLEIRDAVEVSHKTFALGLVLRYSRFYQKIREILDSGVIGKLISFEFNETLHFNHGGYIFGNWRRSQELSGGHVLEKCCHDIDLANWFAGSLPVRIASFGGTNFFIPENEKLAKEIGPNANGYEAYRGWEESPHIEKILNPFTSGADIYDNQVAILEYANGVRATFHTNCNAGIHERRMIFNGTKGTLRGDLITGTLELGLIGWNAKKEDVFAKSLDGHGGGDEIMAQELCRTLLEGAPPYASVNEGIYSAVTALAMDESVREKKIVDLTSEWKKLGCRINREEI